MPDKKTKAELRLFGLMMTVTLAALGGVLWWRAVIIWPSLLAAAGVFLGFALIGPQALAPIERVWMKAARALGTVTTIVILTMAYYLIITPTGLFFRLLRKDRLRRVFDPKTESYWTPVDPEGPAGRSDKPF